MGFDKLLLDHVGLPLVVILAVHLVIFLCWMGLGDHPKTFLLKALFRQSTPSWLKVMGGGGWVACEILLSALGLGVVSILDSLFSILYSIPRSQVPGPGSQVPSPKSQSQSQSLDNNERSLK